MNRPPAVLWIAVVLLLLVPTAAGRLLLDLAGGLLIALLALPLILSGLGWIGWKLLQSRMMTCTACGATGLKGTGICAVWHALWQRSRHPRPFNSGPVHPRQ